MPTSLSAKKRMRQTEKRQVRNRRIKSALRTQIRKVEVAVDSGDAEAARREYQAAVKAIDKAVTKGVLHRNTAGRRKSRLAALVNTMAAQTQEG